MSTTVNMTRAGFAIISSELGMEEFNDHTSGSVFLTYYDPGFNYLLAKFKLSGNDKYREIISSQVLLSGSSGHSSGYGLLGYQMLNKAFLPETVTYKSIGIRGFGESTHIKFPTETTISLPASLTKDLIQYGIGFHSDNYGKITLSTAVNANITLSDDYVYQKIKSVSPTGNVTLSRQQPNVFSVETQPNTSLYIELPAISSVKFRYREKSAASYKEVDNGTALSYEMPGNLMPTGEMEFQWAVTDILGHTETSAWTTVKTENKVLISTSPTGNVFINRFKDAFFGYTAAPGVVVKKFRYRKSGETEWVENAVSDTQKGYTLSAGTITEGAQFEYGWLSTDRYNAQWSNDGYKFYTTDAISSCQIVEPMRTIVDSDKKTVFRWRHIISTGSDQTKAELQRSRNGSTWLGIGTVEGKKTELEFAEKTFTSGTWYWRARTYNADGVAGEWSAAAQFVAIGSPTTPAITVLDYSPKPEIRWETSEQTAYEISLDGVNETIYGPDKTWKSRAYLADGEHIITVRSQNQYGRWSEPGEAIINVLNQTGPGIVLSETGKTLTWETVGAYDRFQIYRDLKLIAETQERVYTDQIANGIATYQVRGCYDSNDNYGLSNAVETETQRQYHEIYNLETGVSLTIKHCGLRNQPVSRSSSRDIKMVHVPGYENPVVERGEYRDVNLNGAAVFFDREEAEAFEAMSGCLVCFITPSGTNYTGILNSVETTPMGLRTDCTFKLTKADGEAVEQTVNLPAFDIDLETGSLIMTASDSYTGPGFIINKLGDLEVRQ